MFPYVNKQVKTLRIRSEKMADKNLVPAASGKEQEIIELSDDSEDNEIKG